MALQTLSRGVFCLHRTLSGSPVAADPAIGPASPLRQECLQTRGADAVLVVAAHDSVGAVTVDVLVYDSENDAFYPVDAGRALSSGVPVRVAVYELPIFVRVVNPNGATGIAVRVAPAEAALRYQE